MSAAGAAWMGATRSIKFKVNMRAEKELLKLLRKLGYKAIRIPASTTSSDPLPNVLATRGNRIAAFAVKFRSYSKAEFRVDRVERLFKFLDLFDAYGERWVVLAVKYPKKWVFFKVGEPADVVITERTESNVSL